MREDAIKAIRERIAILEKLLPKIKTEKDKSDWATPAHAALEGLAFGRKSEMDFLKSLFEEKEETNG